MFGVIPRVMWERKSTPDESHRVLLETNCLLVRTPSSLGLIDAGYGGKTPAKVRRRSVLEDGSPIVRNLEAIGVAPDDIDWVILTHLHFDHVGGCSYADEDGQLHPTFARARHYVQRMEWDDGISGRPELAGAYFPQDFQPLQAAGLLEFVDNDATIETGITTQLTGGHTRGHQLVMIESQGASAVYPCDMCPTSAHVPTFWTMAYDQYPLDIRREKPRIMHDIASQNRLIIFAHDPHTPTGHLVMNNEGEFIFEPLV